MVKWHHFFITSENAPRHLTPSYISKWVWTPTVPFVKKGTAMSWTPGMVIRACNPSTWENKARGLPQIWGKPELPRVLDQPRLQRETLSQNKECLRTLGWPMPERIRGRESRSPLVEDLPITKTYTMKKRRTKEGGGGFPPFSGLGKGHVMNLDN